LSGFNASASVCGPICGDGVLSPGEQCDDGTNAGGYGQCGPGCVRGPYCGDGIVNGPEACDDGKNVSAYGSTAARPAARRRRVAETGKCNSPLARPATMASMTEPTAAAVPLARPARAVAMASSMAGLVSRSATTGINDGSYNNCAPWLQAGAALRGRRPWRRIWRECDDGNTVAGDGLQSQLPQRRYVEMLSSTRPRAKSAMTASTMAATANAPWLQAWPTLWRRREGTSQEQCDDGNNRAATASVPRVACWGRIAGRPATAWLRGMRRWQQCRRRRLQRRLQVGSLAAAVITDTIRPRSVDVLFDVCVAGLVEVAGGIAGVVGIQAVLGFPGVGMPSLSVSTGAVPPARVP